MIIDQINLNQLRIFSAVYRSRSMTVAAKTLHLTQSGVSQHIKSLEGAIGVRLFDRIHQKLVPTSAGTSLFKDASERLYEIERALWAIRGAETELSGTVSVGMPVEFGNNVVMPLVAGFSRLNPKVRFRFTLDFADVMNRMLLEGDLDFAFVDEFRMDRRIQTRKVYDEVIELCILPGGLRDRPKAQTRKLFEALDYVDYQPEAPILRRWFAHHLGTRHISLNVRAAVMDAQGVGRLVLSGLGAGALPGHLFHKLLGEGHRLHRFEGCGRPLKNVISVASLRDRSQSPAASAAQSWITDSLLKSKP